MSGDKFEVCEGEFLAHDEAGKNVRDVENDVSYKLERYDAALQEQATNPAAKAYVEKYADQIEGWQEQAGQSFVDLNQARKDMAACVDIASTDPDIQSAVNKVSIVDERRSDEWNAGDFDAAKETGKESQELRNAAIALKDMRMESVETNAKPIDVAVASQGPEGHAL